MRYRDQPTIEVSQRVRCDVRTAWGLVTDIGLPAHCSSELQAVEWIDDANAVAVGARFRGRNKHEAFGDWATVCEVVEVEDERRWARLREGIWIAILFHLALLSAITWIPKYVFKVPMVIDPIDAIKNRKDLTYLDLPPDALRNLRPKVVIKPVPPKQTRVDKRTLEALNRAVPLIAPVDGLMDRPPGRPVAV